MRRVGFIRRVAVCALGFGVLLSARASACPNVAGAVHDSFGARDDAWTKGAVFAGGGTLSFPIKPNTVAWAINHVDYHSGDATVCADVRIDKAHANEEEAGLLFWMDYSSRTPAFETFTVSPSGRFSLANRSASGGYRVVLRKSNAAVHTSAGASNELIAQIRHGRLSVSVNGVIVATVAQKTPTAAWYAGVFAISPDKKPGAWEFSEFSLSP